MVGRRPRGAETKKKSADRRCRRVDFRAMRKDLFKDAEKLGKNFGAEVAIVTVDSTSGKVYSFGNPSVDSVVNRYLTYINAQNPPVDGDGTEINTAGAGLDGNKKDEEKVEDSQSVVKEKFSDVEDRADLHQVL